MAVKVGEISGYAYLNLRASQARVLDLCDMSKRREEKGNKNPRALEGLIIPHELAAKTVALYK